MLKRFLYLVETLKDRSKTGFDVEEAQVKSLAKSLLNLQDGPEHAQIMERYIYFFIL
jgi:hypothetical protein